MLSQTINIQSHPPCCCRLSCLSSSDNRNPGRTGSRNVSTPIHAVAINRSTISVHAPDPDVDLPRVVTPSSRDDPTEGGTQLPVVSSTQFLSVESMKHAVSIDTIT